MVNNRRFLRRYTKRYFILYKGEPYCVLSLPMITKLDKLINYEGNVYDLTCAAIRRAYQMTVTGEEESAQGNGKIAPEAVNQVLGGDIEFRIEE
jgi:DNA-directed RNA polymerase subunit omega